MKVAGRKHGHQLKKIYGYKLVVRGMERNTIHPFAGCGSEPSNYWKQQQSVEQRPKAFNGFKVFVESLTMFLWLVGIFFAVLVEFFRPLFAVPRKKHEYVRWQVSLLLLLLHTEVF